MMTFRRFLYKWLNNKTLHLIYFVPVEANLAFYPMKTTTLIALDDDDAAAVVDDWASLSNQDLENFWVLVS
jgi:hypothetical protein